MTCFYRCLEHGAVDRVTIAVGGIDRHAVDRVDDARNFWRHVVGVVAGSIYAVDAVGRLDSTISGGCSSVICSSSIRPAPIGELRSYCCCDNSAFGLLGRLFGLFVGSKTLPDGEDTIDDDSIDTFLDLALL